MLLKLINKKTNNLTENFQMKFGLWVILLGKIGKIRFICFDFYTELITENIEIEMKRRTGIY